MSMDARANAIKVRHAFNALHNGTAGLSAFPVFIIEVINDGAWKVVAKPDPSAKPDEFESFEAWVVADPPTGLGAESIKKLKDIVKATDAEGPVRKALLGKPGPKASSSHNITGTLSGTSRSYTLDRLQREAPQLFDAVQRKELSPNAAAIKAGFRTRPVYIPVDRPDAIVAKLRRELDPEVLAMVIKLLSEEN